MSQHPDVDLFGTLKAVVVIIASIIGASAVLWGCAVEPIRRDVDRVISDQRAITAELRAENAAQIRDLKEQINERLSEINRVFEREWNRRGENTHPPADLAPTAPATAASGGTK